MMASREDSEVMSAGGTHHDHCLRLTGGPCDCSAGGGLSSSRLTMPGEEYAPVVAHRLASGFEGVRSVGIDGTRNAEFSGPRESLEALHLTFTEGSREAAASLDSQVLSLPV